MTEPRFDDSHLPTPVAPPYPDWSAYASVPGHIPLSERLLKRIAPIEFGVWRHLFGLFDKSAKGDIDLVRTKLWYGLAEPAVVLSAGPIRIAAYSEELDGVILIEFDEDDLDHLDLEVGQRMLTCNTFGDGGDVCEDIVQGDAYRGHWTNFQPVIADVFSEYRGRIEERKAQLEERLWPRCERLGLEALEKLGDNARSGNPHWSWVPCVEDA